MLILFQICVKLNTIYIVYLDFEKFSFKSFTIFDVNDHVMSINLFFINLIVVGKKSKNLSTLVVKDVSNEFVVVFKSNKVVFLNFFTLKIVDRRAKDCVN